MRSGGLELLAIATSRIVHELAGHTRLTVASVQPSLAGISMEPFAAAGAALEYTLATTKCSSSLHEPRVDVLVL